MAFPDIHRFPVSNPDTYEREMGLVIAALLVLFVGRVPDPKSNARVLELANTPDRWSAGHAVFDEVRNRLLAAINAKDSLREQQYGFEESCCVAIYNATDPPDPFDSGRAFFVPGEAIGLAMGVGVPLEEVVSVLTRTA